MSTSMSSSRTMDNRNPEKRPVGDDYDEPPINLDHLELPEHTSDSGFSFLDEEGERG